MGFRARSLDMARLIAAERFRNILRKRRIFSYHNLPGKIADLRPLSNSRVASGMMGKDSAIRNIALCMLPL